MKVAYYTFKSAADAEEEESSFRDYLPYALPGVAGAGIGAYQGSRGLLEARQKLIDHERMMKDLPELKADPALQKAYHNSLLRTAGGTLAGAAVGVGTGALARGLQRAYVRQRGLEDE